MLKVFELPKSTFGQHRPLSDPFYRWLGNRLMDTLVTYLEDGWGTTVNSRGVIHGHFNEIVIWRSYLRGGETELIESHLIPLLDSIVEDLETSEAEAKNRASSSERENFLVNYSGYRELFIEESRKPNWLSFSVQRHFMAFAGELDSAWRYCRRLDPNQPSHDYRHFHELAGLRDEVFSKPSGATVTAYLEEVSRLRALGNYEELVAYVQLQDKPHNRMKDYDEASTLALEDELTVNGLWGSISL